MSAYDRTPENFSRAWEIPSTQRPTYVVRYTSFLVDTATFGLRSGLNAPSTLRWSIPTAETMFAEYQAVLEFEFSCPVSTEYGSIEIGLIAHYDESMNKIKVPWISTYMATLQADQPSTQASLPITVTALDDRRFALINYERLSVLMGSSGQP